MPRPGAGLVRGARLLLDRTGHYVLVAYGHRPVPRAFERSVARCRQGGPGDVASRPGGRGVAGSLLDCALSVRRPRAASRWHWSAAEAFSRPCGWCRLDAYGISRRDLGWHIRTWSVGVGWTWRYTSRLRGPARVWQGAARRNQPGGQECFASWHEPGVASTVWPRPGWLVCRPEYTLPAASDLSSTLRELARSLQLFFAETWFAALTAA